MASKNTSGGFHRLRLGQNGLIMLLIIIGILLGFAFAVEGFPSSVTLFGVFSTGLSMVSINSTGTFNAFSLSSTPVWFREGLERSWAIIKSGRLAITLSRLTSPLSLNPISMMFFAAGHLLCKMSQVAASLFFSRLFQATSRSNGLARSSSASVKYRARPAPRCVLALAGG